MGKAKTKKRQRSTSMSIHEVNYTHSNAEFEEMRELLVASYLVNKRPFNWRLAMIENWNYASRYLEPVEYFTSRVHLWRNASGELVSFLIRDNALIYPQVRDGYRFLEAEMFAWAELNWASEVQHTGTMVYDWDIERQNLLTQRGYQNRGAIEDVRIYDLDRTIPEAVIPPGFRITSLAEYGHHSERIELENGIWGAHLDEAWFRGKSSAPSYSAEWDLIAISPGGRMAAQSLVWLYPRNQMAEIDPVGTHPDFRRRGLSRALVLESFRRIRENGMYTAYIASEAQDPIVSHLYGSLQPAETYQGHHWTRQVPFKG
jgi:GNAT superfamily N-acetyltransferase